MVVTSNHLSIHPTIQTPQAVLHPKSLPSADVCDALVDLLWGCCP